MALLPEEQAWLQAPWSGYFRLEASGPAMLDAATHKAGLAQLPPSVLATLVALQVPPPYWFQIRVAFGDGSVRQTCLGVSAFTAPEGICYLPRWVCLSASLARSDLRTCTAIPMDGGLAGGGVAGQAFRSPSHPIPALATPCDLSYPPWPFFRP